MYNITFAKPIYPLGEGGEGLNIRKNKPPKATNKLKGLAILTSYCKLPIRDSVSLSMIMELPLYWVLKYFSYDAQIPECSCT